MRVGYLLVMSILSFFIVGFFFGIIFDPIAQLYLGAQGMGTHAQFWGYVYSFILLGGFWISYVFAQVIGWIVNVLREGGD